MNLILETTTGKLVPAGEPARLARGGVQALTLQLLTNGVAGLLPDGQPIVLSIFAPDDLVTPVLTVSAWTADGAGVRYSASLNTLAGALAWVQSATYLARIDYGSPNAASGLFHLIFGDGAAAPGATPQITITQPSGPVDYTEVIGTFGGKVMVNQTEGFWRVKSAGQILGLQLSAQDAPTGAAIIVEIYKGGVATGKTATLAAAAKNQETIFGSPLAIAIGDVIQFRPTQVGSTKPGTNLTVRAVVRLS
jgi:hypothetical protein